MTAKELDRRVNQLDNDVLSLYELVTTIAQTQAEHTVQLTGLRGRLDEHTVQLAQLRAAAGEHEQRLDGIDARLDGIDARLADHDKRFDRIDASLEEILDLLKES